LDGEVLRKVMAVISVAFFTASVALAVLGKYVASILALLGGLALVSYSSVGKGESHSEE